MAGTAALALNVWARRRNGPVPPHEQEFYDALLSLDKLRKEDPEAAGRKMEDLVEAQVAAERIYLADLVARAPQNRSVAKVLRKRLLHNLDINARVRRDHTEGNSNGADGWRRALDEEERDLRQQLAQVDQLLGRST